MSSPEALATQPMIMVVSDDGDAAADLVARLNEGGYAARAVPVSGWREAGSADEEPADLALVDLRAGDLGESNGSGTPRGMPVVYLTDGSDPGMLRRARNAGVSGCLVKPVATAQLHLAVDSALSSRRREMEGAETIRRLRRKNERLRSRERLLATILDNVAHGVVAADDQGDYVFTNASVKKILGGDLPDTKMGRRAEEWGFYRLDRRTPVTVDEMPLPRALRGHATDDFRIFVRNARIPDGMYVNIAGRPVEFDDGSTGAVLVFGNVSHAQRVEDELRETTRRLEGQSDREQHELMAAVFASMSDGVAVADAEGRFQLFNPAAEEIVGHGMLEVPPDEWTDRYGLFLPDRKTRFATEDLPLVRAICGKRSHGVEMFVRNELRPEGLYILVNGEPLPENRGGVVVFRDVTAQRHSERERERVTQQLEKQTELMHAVFDGIGDGILSVDAAGRVVHVNRAAKALTKIDRVGGRLSDRSERFKFHYPDRKTPVEEADLPILRAALGGETVNEEDFVLVTESNPDGITMRISAQPLVDSSGSIGGGVAILRDVTQERQAEEALAAAFAQGRIEIIDTILHNIGNAITSVETGVDTIIRMLCDDVLAKRLQAVTEALEAHSGDWADYIENDVRGRVALPLVIALARDLIARDKKIRMAAKRAKTRSEHITDIIRTQGALKNQSMSRKEIELESTLATAVGLLEGRLRSLGVEIAIECEEAPRTIKTQESELQQMIVNLVGNSIDALESRGKQEDSGWKPRIRIRCHVARSNLVIDVEDNGIGIRPDHLTAIFRAGFSNKERGTGLGLHSAAVICQRSGGRIQAFSEGVGRGARMRVELRLSSLGVTMAAGSGGERGEPRSAEATQRRTGFGGKRSGR